MIVVLTKVSNINYYFCYLMKDSGDTNPWKFLDTSDLTEARRDCQTLADKINSASSEILVVIEEIQI